MAERRPPSMVDVARRAGVAHVTVSRVLNGENSVRPATRDRILQAIDELGYQRNDSARVLKRGRSGMLGVILAGADLYELPRVLSGVEEAARGAGYWVSVSSWQGGSPELLAATIDRLLGQAAEGVTIIADRPLALPALERLVARIPVSVVMSGDVPNVAVGSVELDQDLGGRLIARHILDQGHRKVAHLSGRMGIFDARARAAGWVAELESAGVDATDVLAGDFTAESGYRLMRDLLARPILPSAVFAGNDQMAIGALAALAERGLKAPDDISLVGFDDISGSDYLVPALTTVRQDFVQLGRRSIEVLIELIGGGTPQHHLIEPTLVVRRSTRAL